MRKFRWFLFEFVVIFVGVTAYDSLIDRRVADYKLVALGDESVPDSVVVNSLNLQGRRFNVTSFYSTIILSENENRLLIDNEELLGEIRVLEIFINYYNAQQALIDEYYNQYVYPVVVLYEVTSR